MPLEDMAERARCSFQCQKTATAAKCLLQCHSMPDSNYHKPGIRVPLPSRRIILGSSVALISGFTRQAEALDGDWSSPGLSSPIDESEPVFFKTPGGAKVQVLSEGSGPTIKDGDTLEIDYVCRRPNGYFIYSTVEGVSFQPLDVPTGPLRITLGDASVIKGMTEALTGLKIGSKIRALIPPNLGYLNANLEPNPPTFAAKRQIINHGHEPLIFEVKVLKLF